MSTTSPAIGKIQNRIDSLRWSRTLLYDGYWPPFHPQLEYDPASAVALAREMHANVIRFGCIAKWALYPSTIMPTHPQLDGRDLLQETIAHAAKAGIRVIAYLPVGHVLPQSLLKGQLSAWAMQLDDGPYDGEFYHFGGPSIAPLCPFGKYRSDILRIAEEICSYDIEALYIDGPYYGQMVDGICQCDSCRDGFFAATGHNLPCNSELARALGDEQLQTRVEAHKHWVARELVALMRNLRSLTSGRGLPLLFNLCAAEFQPPPHQQELVALSDGFLLESSMGGIKGQGQGRLGDKLVWGYTQAHNPWPRMTNPLIEERNAISAALSVSRGATPIVSYAGRLLLDKRWSSALTQVFSTVDRLEQHAAATRPLRYCALITDSALEKTESWTRHHKEAHDKNLYAAWEMLKTVHMPVDILPKAAVTEPGVLDAYAVVVLASVPHLSPDQAAALRHFVQNGGGLVVTGPTGLSGPTGERLNQPVLQDLLGARLAPIEARRDQILRSHWWSQAGSPWDIYIKCADAGAKPEDGDAAPILRCGPFEVLEPHPESAVSAHIVCGSGYERLAPACVENRWGTGLTAWFASPVELDWASTQNSGGDPELCAWFCSIVERTARLPIPCRLESGEGDIALSIAQDPDGQCAVVHIVDQNDKRRQVSVLASVALGKRRVKNAILASSGESAGWSCDGEYTRFSLALTRYEAVILQTEPR